MKQIIRYFLYKNGYNNSILQKVWITLMSPYVNYKNRQKSKRIRIIGEDLLLILKRISEQVGIDIWPEFGTLLGAYRDKSFISYDPDIDMGLFSDSFTDELMTALLKYGIKRKRSLYLIDSNSNEKRLIEMSLTYKGLIFDVFLSDKVNENSRRVYVSYEKINELDNKYKVKFYTVEYSGGPVVVQINDIKLHYPGDASVYLRSIYGDSFMTPIKDWRPPKRNHILTYLDETKIYAEEERFD